MASVRRSTANEATFCAAGSVCQRDEFKSFKNLKQEICFLSDHRDLRMCHISSAVALMRVSVCCRCYNVKNSLHDGARRHF